VTYAVLSSFSIDAAITNPWGIAYDNARDTLWISNQADNSIYQVQTVPEAATLGILASSGALLLIRRKK